MNAPPSTLNDHPTMHAVLIFSAIISFGLFIQLQLRARANPKGLPLPPGPRPLPIVGNSRDLSKPYIWLEFVKWRKTYGDLIHLKVFGQSYIILNSIDSVNDLLDKKSAIYSDRPKLPMLVDLYGDMLLLLLAICITDLRFLSIGFSFAFSFFQYGDEWRRHRRIFHEYFHSEKVARHQKIKLLETRRFLKRLLVDPEGFSYHIKQ